MGKITNIILVLSNLLGTIFCGISAYFGAAIYYGWRPTAEVTGMKEALVIPYWPLIVFGTLGIVLIASTWIFGYKIFKKAPSPITTFADTAEIILHFYGDERAPTRMSFINIWRWYFLRNIFIGIEKDTGNEVRKIISNLFITFDIPVKIGTLEVRSPDFQMPRHEVKEFTNRYAIIAFMDELPAGTLTITVRQ